MLIVYISLLIVIKLVPLDGTNYSCCEVKIEVIKKLINYFINYTYQS